jgi:hypothetical protein
MSALPRIVGDTSALRDSVASLEMQLSPRKACLSQRGSLEVYSKGL